MTVYALFKFIHILGVVLLVGNVTVTSVWKLLADRTRCGSIVAYAQRMVSITDWTFTLAGIVCISLGGYVMAAGAGFSLTAPWLLWSQLLFLASGMVWLCILLPIQIAQSRQSRGLSAATHIPPSYLRLSRRWLLWGIAATIPLAVAMYLMIVK